MSVHTPVHNGAAYIEECMTSVLGQTYANWSYTVLDNCSTDATPDLVDAFTRKDSRIRHLRFEALVDANENHNRAFALVDADSVYCKIVQGDDWLYPECLERMVERAESAASIGIVGSYWLQEDRVGGVGLPYWKTCASGRDILRQSLLGGPYVTGGPTATLLRSDLVRSRQPFWDVRLWHGDTDALYWVLTQSDFGYVHQVLTFARRQPGARSTFSSRVNTYDPENIRFLLRYGPTVLERDEYRTRLRMELTQYVSWHARQVPKPSRATDPEFFAYHWEAAESIVHESGNDPRVRAAMSVVRALLSREHLVKRFRPGSGPHRRPRN